MISQRWMNVTCRFIRSIITQALSGFAPSYFMVPAPLSTSSKVQYYCTVVVALQKQNPFSLLRCCYTDADVYFQHYIIVTTLHYWNLHFYFHLHFKTSLSTYAVVSDQQDNDNSSTSTSTESTLRNIVLLTLEIPKPLFSFPNKIFISFTLNTFSTWQSCQSLYSSSNKSNLAKLKQTNLYEKSKHFNFQILTPLAK